MRFSDQHRNEGIGKHWQDSLWQKRCWLCFLSCAFSQQDNETIYQTVLQPRSAVGRIFAPRFSVLVGTCSHSRQSWQWLIRLCLWPTFSSMSTLHQDWVERSQRLIGIDRTRATAKDFHHRSRASTPEVDLFDWWLEAAKSLIVTGL